MVPYSQEFRDGIGVAMLAVQILFSIGVKVVRRSAKRSLNCKMRSLSCRKTVV